MSEVIRTKIIYSDGAYYVNRPFDGGEVVDARDYDNLEQANARMVTTLANVQSKDTVRKAALAFLDTIPACSSPFTLDLEQFQALCKLNGALYP